MFKSVNERKLALNNYWPNITIFLEGYNYTLTPNDYYFEYNEEKKIGACIGFEGESCSKITIGGTFMHGHDIIFDKENQMMGFAEADCNRGQNKKDNNTNDNNTFIKEEEIFKVNFVQNWNDIFLYGIIIASCLVVLCLIILVICLMKKRNKMKKYNEQVDESTGDKKNENNNQNNNILEIKNQNTNNKNNVSNT